MKSKSYKKLDEEVKPSPWEERPERLKARLASYLASPTKMDSLIEKIKATPHGRTFTYLNKLQNDEILKDKAVEIVERVFALVLRTNRAEHQTWLMLEACGMNVARLELLEDLLKDRYVCSAPLSEESVSAHLESIKVLGAYNNGLVFVERNYADVDFAVGSTFSLDQKEYTLTYVFGGNYFTEFLPDGTDLGLPVIPQGVKTLCRFEPEIPGLTRLTTWDSTARRKYLDFVSAPEPEPAVEPANGLRQKWDSIKNYTKRLFTNSK